MHTVLCGICTGKHVDMYISCILCFQSGGRGVTSSGAEGGGMGVSSAERMVAPVDWVGKVEIVSKTCVHFGMKRSVNELMVVRGMLK